MLDLLYQRGIKKLLVEGGGTIIWSFLRNRLVDDLYTYIGPCIIGGKNTPTVADGSGIKSEDCKFISLLWRFAAKVEITCFEKYDNY
jgi:2,5-diamino-6-(ribosylamino)-4(3H)-pyrimidinone 5'-phosphate reductase